MRFNFELYFKKDFSRFKYFGVWINDGLKKPRMFPQYCFATNILFVLLFNLLQVINLLVTVDSLRKLASSGYIITTCCMSSLKSFIFFKNRYQFEKLATTLNDDIFQPKNNRQDQLVGKNFTLYIRVKILLAISCSVTVISSMTTPLFYKKDEQNLPMAAWYPFDTSSSAVYTIVYIHQCIAVLYVSCINIYLEILMSGLSTFIATQCDLLCDNLRNIGRDEDTLTDCIKHHWKILEYARIIEAVFSPIYIAQFFASTVALCMTLFLLTLVEKNTFEFFYLVTYQSAMFLLLLVPCWFATQITTKSENIPFAAYECAWVDGTHPFKKDLLYFIHISQKPIQLYAIRFIYISVETFAKIARLSFSYFAVLNNLMKNESGNN